MCFDGSDLRYFNMKVAESYSKFVAAGDYTVEIKSGTRSADQVYAQMSEEDKKHAMSLYKNVSTVRNKFVFPFGEDDDTLRPRLILRKLAAENFLKMKARGKKSGATVNDIYNKVLGEGVELTIGGRTLSPVQDRVPEDASTFQNAMMGMNSGTIVLPDDLVAKLDLPPYYSYLLVNYAEDVSVEKGDAYINAYRTYGDVTNAEGASIAGWGQEATRTTTYESVDSMNGLISYLAIYIGFVLVVACAAILTIQQLSGVADAGKNYRILSELGTPATTIAHSVLAQQTVFFLFPLAMGIAHSAVALKVIIELVALFGGLSIGGTVGLTCAIFVVAYGGYFCVTYLMSKGMVRDAIRARHAL